ncbi:unnamed protein product [Symbiodinium sp. CCMP2592]|nr:unnamed protein product [Symbiodinium sp. CCMP2592]
MVSPEPLLVEPVTRLVQLPRAGLASDAMRVGPVRETSTSPAPGASRTLQRLANLLERHRSELHRELRSAKMVLQQPSTPAQPSRTPRPPQRPPRRLVSAPAGGACQVEVPSSSHSSASSCGSQSSARPHRSASGPGLPALAELHAMADSHCAALSRLGS